MKLSYTLESFKLFVYVQSICLFNLISSKELENNGQVYAFPEGLFPPPLFLTPEGRHLEEENVSIYSNPLFIDFTVGNGRTLRLDLGESRQIYSSKYRETEYDPATNTFTGREVDIKTNCHYHGNVLWEERVFVHATAISICGKVTGIVLYGGDFFEINFQYGEKSASIRKLYADEKLLNPMMNVVDVVMQPVVKTVSKSNFSKESKKQTASSPLSTDLTVELLVINDGARVQMISERLVPDVSGDTAAVINQVQLFFSRQQELFDAAIEILLVEQVHFSQDPEEFNTIVSEELLDKLNEWRVQNIDSLAGHDALHLFTGKDLQDNTLGIAYLGTVCDDDGECESLEHGFCYVDEEQNALGCCQRYAGALSQVHSLKDAHTVAHEIGHQLGFFHDSEDDAANCTESGHIMSAISNLDDDLFQHNWSSCSVATFNEMYRSPPNNYGYHPYQCLVELASSSPTPSPTTNPSIGRPTLTPSEYESEFSISPSYHLNPMCYFYLFIVAWITTAN